MMEDSEQEAWGLTGRDKQYRNLFWQVGLDVVCVAWVWWHLPVTSAALRRLKHEASESEKNLGYTVRFFQKQN